MKYFGLILIPLVVALLLGGPGCTQSQDEPAVKMEQAPEKQVEAPVVEEAEEVVEASKREDIIWEDADVLYFLTVLLAKHDIQIDDVLNELRRRRRK